MTLMNPLSVMLLMTVFRVTEGSVNFCFSTDPCISTSVSVLDVVGRSTNCPFYGTNGLCDSRLPDKWYRTDTPMTNTCPPLSSCGTYYPVWLNGFEPTESEGMVNRTACVKGIIGCCVKKYDIVLKNCSTFMAYCLQHLTECAERYCFGDSGSCPTAPPPTTTSTMATTQSNPAPLKTIVEDNDQNAFTVATIVVGVVTAIVLIMCIGNIIWTCSKKNIENNIPHQPPIRRDVPRDPLVAADINEAGGLRGRLRLPPINVQNVTNITEDKKRKKKKKKKTDSERTFRAIVFTKCEETKSRNRNDNIDQNDSEMIEKIGDNPEQKKKKKKKKRRKRKTEVTPETQL